MSKSYHMDLSEISLEEFELCLGNRELIPSRQPLKKDLAKRFAILQGMGLKNMADLVAALATAGKITDFSQKSSLPADYLTLLKREASSYLANPVPLRSFPGIDPDTVAILEDNGLKNSKQIFEKIQGDSGLKDLSRIPGLNMEILKELYALSDLCRLYGVGPVFARIIHDAGIHSVKEFLQYNSQDFIRLYEQNTGKRADFSQKDMDFTLELARNLSL